MPALMWSLFSSIFCSRFGAVLWLAVAVGANGVIRRKFLFCMGMGLAAVGGADGFSGCLFGEGSLKPLQKNVEHPCPTYCTSPFCFATQTASKALAKGKWRFGCCGSGRSGFQAAFCCLGQPENGLDLGLVQPERVVPAACVFVLLGDEDV